MASVAQQRAIRVQAGLLAALLAAAAVAWLLTRDRMLGMDAGPGTNPGGLGFYTASWLVMMAAMMFPSIAPMVLTFATIQRRRRERGALDRTTSTWIFVAGYLVTWTAFGLAAYGLYVGVRSLSIPELSWHRGGRYLAGAVLVAAAVYQLTPAKDACLRRCRGPLDFLLTQWREGPWGALRMGVVHGAWCVGCCWALMASLFALGVMSLTWMIVVAALIAVEKLLPSKILANRSVAALLLVLGIGVALAPKHVPGLTIPDSQAAARAMQKMGMPAHGMRMPKAGAAMPKHGMSKPGGGEMKMREGGGKALPRTGGMAMPEGGAATPRSGGAAHESGMAAPTGPTGTSPMGVR
jgi:predicted metal-binding membrane protein